MTVLTVVTVLSLPKEKKREKHKNYDRRNYVEGYKAGAPASVVAYPAALQRGGVAEWFKAAVLKTAVLQGTVGSNPTPSATSRRRFEARGTAACRARAPAPLCYHLPP